MSCLTFTTAQSITTNAMWMPTVCDDYRPFGLFAMTEKSGFQTHSSSYFSLSDIPNLLIPDELHGSRNRDDSAADASHPGVQVAHVAAAIDDGLGAFRPSTSFNDLTTLLNSNPTTEPSTTTAAALPKGVQVSAPASPVTNTTTTATTKVTKKRKNAATTDSSTSPKKRGGPRGGGRKPSVKKQGVVLPGIAPVVAAPPPTALVTVPVKVALPESGPQGHHPIQLEPVSSPTTEEEDTPNPLDEEAVPMFPSVPSTIETQAPASPVRAVSEDTVILPSSPKRGKVSSSSSDDEDDEEVDEEFTKMAQVAVSNLIASAGKEEGVRRHSDDEKVDTSSEHIKALTGNNWVTACAGASIGSNTVPALNDPKGANNRARRQNLTADERARQNRDRNREHARNTRLRKKAYVEELKRTLVELVAQRDATDFEKRQSIQREIEQREVRFRVMEEFLKLRGRNETNAARWSAILEDGFTFTIPVTSFRKMVDPSQASTTEQVLHGVSDCMADAELFSTFLQGTGNKAPDGKITFTYQMDRKNFFMDGCTGLLDWDGVTLGSTKVRPLCDCFRLSQITC